MNKYSFKEIETYLLNKGLLRIRRVNSTNISLYDFIKTLLSDSSWAFHTYYAKNGRSQDTGGSRSVGDIYRICKSYYPKLSLVEVYNVLMRLVREKRIHSSICSIVRKRVYHSNDGGNPSPYNRFDGATTDEFGVDLSKIEGSTLRPNPYSNVEYLTKFKVTK